MFTSQLKNRKLPKAAGLAAMLIAFAAVLGSISSVANGQATPVNLLANPGFETWSSGLPASWTAYGPATSLTHSTSVLRSGTSSVKIATTSTTAAAAGVSDASKPTISSTVIGTTYTASCWTKVSKSTTIDVQLHELTQAGASVKAAAITALAVPTTTSWYQVKVAYTAVGSGNKMQMIAYGPSLVKGGAVFYLDDCSLTAVDTTAPTAPTSLTATANSPTQINLSWQPSADNVGVTGYRILRGATIIGTTTTATSFTDGTALPGTAYGYSVKALDAAGNLSAASATANVTTPFIAPTAPTSLTATATSPSQVSLSWTASTPGSGTITAYQIVRNGAVIATTAGTSFADATVSPNTSYTYAVDAQDSNSLTSPLSTSATVTTPALVPPSAPTSLAATATGFYQINLSWAASIPGTGAITGYQIMRNGTLLATVTSTSYNDTSVTSNTSYTYAVGAVDSNALTSPLSASITATTPALVPPSAPTSLTATATSLTEINLSWTASTPGSGAITGYQITQNGSLLTTVTGTSYKDLSLTAGGTGVYTVTATDSYGSLSAPSNSATDTTPANASTPYTLAEWNSALSSVIHADVTDSVALPDGRILWDFGDTTQVNGVSTVGYYGYPHDAFVTQAPGTLNFTAIHGNYGYGWQQVPNWSDGTIFWMSKPVVDGNTLYVFGDRIQMSGGSFSVVGAYLAAFDATTLAYQSITALPAGPNAATVWGGAVLTPTGWWVTGSHRVPCSYATYCTVGDAAFAPLGNLTNPTAWQYYDDVMPASLNIGEGFSLVMVSPTDWVAYTKRGGAYGSNDIEQLSATSVTGPWTVTGTWPAPYPSGALTYGVVAHSEQTSPTGQILVSYDVNGGDSSNYHALFEYLPLP